MQKVNDNVTKHNVGMKLGQASVHSNKDTVYLSPYGRTNSIVSGLEKLKNQIEDRRSEFLAKANEEDKPAEVIKAEMDSFDQQIKNIDKQIVQITIQQMSQDIEKAKQKSKISSNKPKTRQEIENTGYNNSKLEFYKVKEIQYNSENIEKD